jgi:hypothetical protein
VEEEKTCITKLQQSKQSAVARQRLYKHVSAAIEADATSDGLLNKKHATISKLLEAVFSMRSAPRLKIGNRNATAVSG